MAGGLDEAVVRLADHSRVLWAAAVVFYGFGDTITTLAGLVTGRGVEAGPVAVGLLSEYGLVGFLGLKLGALSAFYLLWRLARPPGRVAVPLALTIVGVGVTAWNALVLAT